MVSGAMPVKASQVARPFFACDPGESLPVRTDDAELNGQWSDLREGNFILRSHNVLLDAEFSFLKIPASFKKRK